MTAKLQTVHVRVNDKATGQPTPCRVRFTDADGRYYAPFGRLTTFSVGFGENVGGNVLLNESRWLYEPEYSATVPYKNTKYAYIDGACEVGLPPGLITVEVSKGPEYVPISETIHLPVGKMALRLDLERWINLKNEGWFSGDCQAHFLSPHGALLEGAAEDLAYVNLLAFELKHLNAKASPHPGISNILAFSGKQPVLESSGHCVVVNTLNQSAILNTLALLNCHRVVYPLILGQKLDRSMWRLSDLNLSDWCNQCHRKGGLVIWTDVLFGSICEAVAEVILGNIDALQTTSLDWCACEHSEWYTLLNAGFKIPLVGASAKDSNAKPLGVVRTYAQLLDGEKPSYGNWIEAVRAGRIFITTGPILHFSVNGKKPGSLLYVSGDSEAVHFSAEARSTYSFEKLEVVFNGKVIAMAVAKGSPCEATLEGSFNALGGGWLAARCWGDRHPPLACYARHGAHTAPVYLQTSGKPFRPDRGAIDVLTQTCDESIATVDKKCRFESEKQRDRLVGIFVAAKEELQRRAKSS